MINKKISIQVDGSLENTHAITYILDTPECLDIKERPLVIVCPGGGYEYVSEREGEPIALAYNNMGFHAIVLNYSVAPAVYPTALLELSKLVSIVHRTAYEWKVDTKRIFIQGFSAGGHLAASFGVNWKKEFIYKTIGATLSELEIAGLILAYPVITSGEYAHKGSFEKLLGLKSGALEGAFDIDMESMKLLEELSLEKQVNEDVPPCFIWTTFEDGSVPAENAIEFMRALRNNKIRTEFHMFPYGGHGLSLATELTRTSDGKGVQPEVKSWTGMVKFFVKNA